MVLVGCSIGLKCRRGCSCRERRQILHAGRPWSDRRNRRCTLDQMSPCELNNHPGSSVGSNRFWISVARRPQVGSKRRIELDNRANRRSGSQISSTISRSIHTDNISISHTNYDTQNLRLQDVDAVHEVIDICLNTPFFEQLSKKDFKREAKKLVFHENFGKRKPEDVLIEVVREFPELSGPLLASSQPLLHNFKSLK